MILHQRLNVSNPHKPQSKVPMIEPAPIMPARNGKKIALIN